MYLSSKLRNVANMPRGRTSQALNVGLREALENLLVQLLTVGQRYSGEGGQGFGVRQCRRSLSGTSSRSLSGGQRYYY